MSTLGWEWTICKHYLGKLSKALKQQWRLLIISLREALSLDEPAQFKIRL
jgi:hypothetical protein